jgi:hypothetical protein
MGLLNGSEQTVTALAQVCQFLSGFKGARCEDAQQIVNAGMRNDGGVGALFAAALLATAI